MHCNEYVYINQNDEYMSVTEIPGVLYKIYKNKAMNCGFACLLGKYKWAACDNYVPSEAILYSKGPLTTKKKQRGVAQIDMKLADKIIYILKVH